MGFAMNHFYEVTYTKHTPESTVLTSDLSTLEMKRSFECVGYAKVYMLVQEVQ